MSERISLTTGTGDARLDKFIGDNSPQLSRTRARRLIDDGLVTVNGRVEKASFKLGAGDKIEIIVPPEEPSRLAAENIPLKIIYEDADLLVVDKPAGLTVHPAPGHPSGTVVNAVLGYLPAAGEGEESERPGIVHRLDKDTSGLLLVARNRAAQENLSDQFKNRAVKKTYLALVKGRLTPERGIIEAEIGRDKRNRQKMAVVSSGREARTEYRVLKYVGRYTLLEIKPETGRTHQIRVHLAAIGFPVAGDEIYGQKTPGLSRQFLHAHKLKFKLPSTGEEVEFTSPLPEDLERALGEMSG